ncbi:MAG: hypothetical protein RI967_1885 [Planctomycetota bacterium]
MEPVRFERASPIDADAEALGAWHFREGAIVRLIPPWERIAIDQEASPLVDGARAVIRIRKGPLSVRLVARHEAVDPPRAFTDVQESGPFGSWRHRHSFEPAESGAGSVLRDAIAFTPPLGFVGRALATRPLLREIERQFAFRHARTAADLRRHAEVAARFGGAPLRVGVTGASGMLGRQLCAFLSTGGHEVVRFVRGRASAAGERPWNPTDPKDGLAPALVEDLDAIVHFAGAGIADGRWNPERKRLILASRVDGTGAVAQAVARAERKPVVVSASGVGYYGDRGDERLDEGSAMGSGFLPEVVAAWEAALRPAEAAGARCVRLRFGVVLSASGGALARMRTPFLLGAGGPVGSGRQGMSWISLDDALGVILHAIRDPSLAGVVNAVAPGAVAQRVFARTLGRVLGRPAFAPLPSLAVAALFGEMGRRLLLEGAFVRPRRLEEIGFRFEHPALEDALRLELGRSAVALAPAGGVL